LPYLVSSDYNKTIQADNLAQIIGANFNATQAANLQAAAETVAVNICKSKLIQRYNVDQEFTDTLPWNPALAYNAKSKVVVDGYPPYSNTATYTLNSCVLYNGSGYICSTAISVPEAFYAAHWTLLGPQYTLFYSALPYPEFNYKGNYKPGDIVFWKNYTYTCIKGTIYYDTDTTLQFLQIQDIPLNNVFPDDPVNGVTAWGTGTNYNVPAYTILTNTTYWTLGDIRDPMLVSICVDLALYELHSRISPRNIPDLRVKRRDDGIRALEKMKTGEDTAVGLASKQPAQGRRIRYGGQIKQNNTY
jgi:hypothetical protein